MARLAIPKVRDDRDPVEYRLRIEPQLNDELLLYRQLYIRTYQPVSELIFRSRCQ